MFKPYKNYLFFDVLFFITFLALSIETGHILYATFVVISAVLAYYDYKGLKEIPNGT